jgi:hypothetical protein
MGSGYRQQNLIEPFPICLLTRSTLKVQQNVGMLYKVGLDMNLSMYLGRSNPNPFGIGFGHTQEIS